MQQLFRHILVTALAAVLVFPPGLALAAEQAPAPGDVAAPKLSSAQLEQLAAPVALYPDSLLAQVLMASTYPLEVVDAARWVKANPKLKGQALDAAVQKQSWDPSVKSLVKFPQVLQMMDEKLDWTEKLGNAFLAQPQDVMDATQRLRAKAVAEGHLKSSKQQTVKVETAPGSSSKIIVVQPAQPDVVYVPSYNPTVVYGPWPYPAYPPYAWYPPGYVAGAAVLSFGVGVAVGSSLWGYPDWHHGDVDIDVNNYAHFNGGHPPPPPPPPPHGGGQTPAGTRPGSDVWSHNPAHRGNVPYGTPDVARRFQRPAQGGISPAQQRINAREAFRGRTGITPGGAGAAGMPGHFGGGGSRFGAGVQHAPGGGTGMPGHLGGDGSRFGAGVQHAPGGGVRQPDAAPRQFQGRTGDRGSIFQGAGAGGAHRDFQRGMQSRQIMHANPGGGFGGFHGGFRR